MNIDKSSIVEIAKNFGVNHPLIEPLGTGLIHQTFKASEGNKAIVLQQINLSVFVKPEILVDNYCTVFEYLSSNSSIRIPAPVSSSSGSWLVKDKNANYWRASEFISGTYSPDTVKNKEEAYATSACFGSFTKALQGLNISRLSVVIADFHDLEYRYQQFEDSINKADLFKSMRATHVIAELRERTSFIDFFRNVKNNSEFPTRLMHHDCKISNILFDVRTDNVVCPIDLDTIMPGKYFSDIGDMIRTMACTENEESRNWDRIEIKKDIYSALINGYVEGTGGMLTKAELVHIHFSGLLMIFMQSLRFITDYLNGDIYYKTSYPEQNLNRALNQLILLEKLEEFLKNSSSSFKER